MTVANDVMRTLCARPTRMASAEQAARLGKSQLDVNVACRRLVEQGLIVRDGSADVIINRVREDAVPPPRDSRPGASVTHVKRGSEGNVHINAVAHLAASGWSIIQVADTARRERGIDIIAEQNGQRLLVEVKDRPTAAHARGEEAGEPEVDPVVDPGGRLVGGRPEYLNPSRYRTRVTAGASVAGHASLPDSARRSVLGAGAANHNDFSR